MVVVNLLVAVVTVKPIEIRHISVTGGGVIPSNNHHNSTTVVRLLPGIGDRMIKRNVFISTGTLYHYIECVNIFSHIVFLHLYNINFFVFSPSK